MKTSREELLKFLKSDNDESPFEEFQNRKIPNYLRRNMEGKLTSKELKDALFNKMHRNSAPGLDGFTVNWLKTFWPELATITKNALTLLVTGGGYYDHGFFLRGITLLLLKK